MIVDVFHKREDKDMKEKLTLATPIILLILIIVILILSNNLNNLNTTIEVMKSDKVIQKPL